MKIQAWVDVTCPYCWLGKHHLEEALRNEGIEADVEYMAFELDPHREGTAPLREYLAKKYGDAAPLEGAHAALAAAGARVGLEYDFEHAVVTNTFDAHRVHNLAKNQGRGVAVMERLMRGRQSEGLDLSDHEALLRLATEAGMDGAEVRVLLKDPTARADEVRREEAQAHAIGVRGVPFFVFEGRFAVVGAQPVEQMVAALRHGASPAAPAVQ